MNQAWNIILFLVYAYWFISLIISIRVLKKSNSEEFRKVSIRFFSSMFILSVLHLLITELGMPGFICRAYSVTPIIHALLLGAIGIITMLLISWYGIKKEGMIIFPFPILFLQQGSGGVEKFFDKQIDLWKTRKRLMDILAIIFIVFTIVPYLIFTVWLLGVINR